MINDKEFKSNLNLDVLTAENLEQTNDKLVEYLIDTDQEDAAEHVMLLMDNQIPFDEKAEQPVQNEYTKRLLNVNKGILESLGGIEEDMVDEQDTSIKSVADSMDEKETKKKEIRKIKGSTKAMGAGGLALGIAGLGYAAYKDITDTYNKSKTANTEKERKEAAVHVRAGIVGMTAGAALGAKGGAMAGGVIGTAAFGVGALPGSIIGGIAGGIAGGTLGYMFGKKYVADYVASVWTGPLDSLTDEQRKTPFTIHKYLTDTFLPSLIATYNAETDPEKKKDLGEQIAKYQDIAKDMLSPKSIQEWMGKSINEDGLDDQDVRYKREYLINKMSQFKDTQYYGLGMAEISNAVPEPSKFQKLSGDIMKGLNGKNYEAKLERERKQARADLNVVQDFNKTNTLGKDGKAIEFATKDGDGNFKKLVRAGIITDNMWPVGNEIKDFEKIKSLPIPVLRSLIKDGGFAKDDHYKLVELLHEKKEQAKSAALAKKATSSSVNTNMYDKDDYFNEENKQENKALNKEINAQTVNANKTNKESMAQQNSFNLSNSTKSYDTKQVQNIAAAAGAKAAQNVVINNNISKQPTEDTRPLNVFK